MSKGKMEISEEEVKKRVSEALEGIDWGKVFDSMPQIPDTICLNCGRSVLVGKC